MIGTIRAALKSITDGEINISAYDTAWVALVRNTDGDDPQFPLCIDWIIRNQLADGSWGDKEYFLVQDRIINTLACIIALKSWNIHHDKYKKGMLFIHENLRRLTEEDEDWMLIGFEITFPALLEIAKNLGLNLPFDEPALQMIYAKREQKLSRHWTREGLPATRDCPLNDIDDTAMGFRLLRLHGYRVSPGVFKHFEKNDGEFVCYHGQSNRSVTATYNLYRAAQVAFPGEDELQRASSYSHTFLEERRASGKLNDKWVIAKDLPGEVGYVLNFPWKVSLPRIETRMYLEQYGGSDDVWIGKVLYRMSLVSNDQFLGLAKADFSNFQRCCRLEWQSLKKGHDDRMEKDLQCALREIINQAIDDNASFDLHEVVRYKKYLAVKQT
ncbi:hypothetical protein PR202_gb08861 [Eleusine coracana subsp. coracana]|uniref:Terpene synthase N-terminal domain-containing protein n=1 Tax=Eleusine coracana subsp. coracana TaxID=191504 RepID=A0AAV5EGU4_ELECO|nr:hypothetical protein PR202_gb08861 [Eleusine coracana subsp. coracana]